MVYIVRTLTLILLIIWESIVMGYCWKKRKQNERNVAEYNNYNMQPITIDDHLALYENEHYQLHMKEANKKNVMEWPFLEQKDLDKCCLKYIDHIMPTVEIDGTTGTMVDAMLRYEKITFQDFSSKKNKIVIVKCKRWNVKAKFYYMARAPELDCFYALLRDSGWHNYYIIVNKYCNFEWPTSNTEVITHRDRKGIIEKLHKDTGQFIAKQEYIHKYEQEHQVLFKTEASSNSDVLPWPYIMKREKIDEYCFQYLQRCNPRKSGNINGVRIGGNLRYTNSHDKKKTIVKVTVVKCVVMKKEQWLYFVTRAPTNDCVYALIRKGHNGNPFEIIFKHCGFEYIKQKTGVSENHVLHDLNDLPKYKIKENISSTLEASSVQLDYKIKQESSDSLATFHQFLSD